MSWKDTIDFINDTLVDALDNIDNYDDFESITIQFKNYKITLTPNPPLPYKSKGLPTVVMTPIKNEEH